MNENLYTNINNKNNQNLPNQTGYSMIGNQNYPIENYNQIRIDQNLSSNYPQNVFSNNNLGNTPYNTNDLPNKIPIPNYNSSQNITQIGPNSQNRNRPFPGEKIIDKFQNKYGILHKNSHGNENNLLYLDNRISTFTQYNSTILCLFILSIFSIFGSIYEFSSDNQRDGYIEYSKTRGDRAYEIMNFFVNMIHISGYFYGLQAYSKQNPSMNKNFEIVVAGLTISNFTYLIIFIFGVRVTFYTWCLNIFFMLMNGFLYYSAKELSSLFEEKERIRIRNNINMTNFI